MAGTLLVSSCCPSNSADADSGPFDLSRIPTESGEGAQLAGLGKKVANTPFAGSVAGEAQFETDVTIFVIPGAQ
ncbi:MAG TPA: hypothetical protein VKS24_12300 [Bradyrhizobium sp.]|nr:hypothetical protein [Bradyrhizobium sp.]